MEVGKPSCLYYSAVCYATMWKKTENRRYKLKKLPALKVRKYVLHIFEIKFDMAFVLNIHAPSRTSLFSIGSDFLV